MSTTHTYEFVIVVTDDDYNTASKNLSITVYDEKPSNFDEYGIALSLPDGYELTPYDAALISPVVGYNYELVRNTTGIPLALRLQLDIDSNIADYGHLYGIPTEYGPCTVSIKIYDSTLTLVTTRNISLMIHPIGHVYTSLVNDPVKIIEFLESNTEMISFVTIDTITQSSTENSYTSKYRFITYKHQNSVVLRSILTNKTASVFVYSLSVSPAEISPYGIDYYEQQSYLNTDPPRDLNQTINEQILPIYSFKTDTMNISTSEVVHTQETTLLLYNTAPPDITSIIYAQHNQQYRVSIGDICVFLDDRHTLDENYVFVAGPYNVLTSKYPVGLMDHPSSYNVIYDIITTHVEYRHGLGANMAIQCVGLYSGSVFATFLLLDNNTVMSAGNNERQVLGRTTLEEYGKHFQIIPNLTDVSKIAVGGGGLPDVEDTINTATCALFLHDDGTVSGCGVNNQGVLGHAIVNPPKTQAYKLPPNLNKVTIDENDTLLTDIIDIAIGEQIAWQDHVHALFLKSDGTVLSSGYNYNGECGRVSYRGPTNKSHYYDSVLNYPAPIPGLTNIKKIWAGVGSSFFIDKYGHLFSCGIAYKLTNNEGDLPDLFKSHLNVYGLLGPRELDDLYKDHPHLNLGRYSHCNLYPVRTPDEDPYIIDVASNSQNLYILTQNNRVYYIGLRYEYQLSGNSVILTQTFQKNWVHMQELDHLGINFITARGTRAAFTNPNNDIFTHGKKDDDWFTLGYRLPTSSVPKVIEAQQFPITSNPQHYYLIDKDYTDQLPPAICTQSYTTLFTGVAGINTSVPSTINVPIRPSWLTFTHQLNSQIYSGLLFKGTPTTPGIHYICITYGVAGPLYNSFNSKSLPLKVYPYPDEETLQTYRDTDYTLLSYTLTERFESEIYPPGIYGFKGNIKDINYNILTTYDWTILVVVNDCWRFKIFKQQFVIEFQDAINIFEVIDPNVNIVYEFDDMKIYQLEVFDNSYIDDIL
jgi:alpha-tubulin suppressor-like RCC1 family protein